jgi:hypothetical protein
MSMRYEILQPNNLARVFRLSSLCFVIKGCTEKSMLFLTSHQMSKEKKLDPTLFHPKIGTSLSLFALLKSQTEKYRLLICCERKIMFLP